MQQSKKIHKFKYKCIKCNSNFTFKIKNNFIYYRIKCPVCYTYGGIYIKEI